MSRHTFPSRSRAAFTLTELIWVVAIVGVLAAILIPVAGSVRASARNVVCKSNLRQWGIALQLFVNDSRQRYLPYEGSDDQVTWAQATAAADAQSWFNVLPPYVGQTPVKNLVGTMASPGLSASAKKTYFLDNKMIYACPCDTRQALDQAATYLTPSYMMNSQLYNAAGPAGTKDGTNTNDGGRLLTLNDFNNAKYPLARIAFMADAGTADIMGTRGRIRGHGDGQGGASTPHGNTANVVFLDGSVRSIGSDDLNSPEAHPATVVWMPW